MKSSVVLLLAIALSLQPLAAQYRPAVPGYRYSFPRDHFNHPDFQTEWWYYTGNLKAADGHRFGFELTFFRQAVSRNAAQTGAWDVQDVHLAHLALSDLDGGKFYHQSRTNRAGPGIAGASESARRIWNGNWQVLWTGDRDQDLQATSAEFDLHLRMHSQKDPIIHGLNGVSQKARGLGNASHYISLTRLAAVGSIALSGKTFSVTGAAWMDHEFFTHQLSSGQVGWDWISAQLDDSTELMLFRIRNKDGSIDPFSAGTFVDAKGATTHLTAAEFTLQPAGATWTSPATRAVYPILWNIAVPRLGINLEVRTLLPSQEFSATTAVAPSYWEGAILLNRKDAHGGANGTGYLEMTGYDRPVQMP